MKTKLLLIVIAVLFISNCENQWMKQRVDRLFAEKRISMVWVPAGSFTMGSPDGSLSPFIPEPGRDLGEVQHTVIFSSGFYIGKYQITQEEWVNVMGNNPSYYNGGPGLEPLPGEIQKKRPVEQISWYDVLVFCNRLSIKEGLNPVYEIGGSTDPVVWGPIPNTTSGLWDSVSMLSGANGYRLPTESEWEYACRAGTGSAFNNGNNDYTNNSLVDPIAWYSYNSILTHEVGKKSPNAWGLYDMHGNVNEWCWDLNGSYPPGPVTDPTGPMIIALGDRVTRGGAFNHGGDNIRSAYRSNKFPELGSNSLGFRLVRRP